MFLIHSVYMRVFTVFTKGNTKIIGQIKHPSSYLVVFGPLYFFIYLFVTNSISLTLSQPLPYLSLTWGYVRGNLMCGWRGK